MKLKKLRKYFQQCSRPNILDLNILLKNILKIVRRELNFFNKKNTRNMRQCFINLEKRLLAKCNLLELMDLIQ